MSEAIPDPEPTIPLALIQRLAHLFTPAQLLVFASLCEEVEGETGHGAVTVLVRAGRVMHIEKSVTHQV